MGATETCCHYLLGDVRSIDSCSAALVIHAENTDNRDEFESRCSQFLIKIHRARDHNVTT